MVVGVNEWDGDPFWYYTHGVGCSEVEPMCIMRLDISILTTIAITTTRLRLLQLMTTTTIRLMQLAIIRSL